jgi:hypothetical protein
VHSVVQTALWPVEGVVRSQQGVEATPVSFPTVPSHRRSQPRDISSSDTGLSYDWEVTLQSLGAPSLGHVPATLLPAQGALEPTG